jgi:hypothetical protein
MLIIDDSFLQSGGMLQFLRDRFEEVPPIRGVSDTAPDSHLDPHPLPKTGTAERKEQGTFVAWLLLQNSKARKIPFSWHATHTRSKATPGTPDFFVGVNGHSMWIEFKRDCGCHLTQEQ